MPKARRTRRVIRKIDAWTVLRFSLLFYLSLAAVLLVAGTLLWRAAAGAGVVGGIEKFLGEALTLENFRFSPGQILRAAVPAGLVLALIGTGLNVLMALLYNLISDLVGGVEVLVDLDEPRTRAQRRAEARRRPSAPAPAEPTLPAPPAEPPEQGEPVEFDSTEEPARTAS